MQIGFRWPCKPCSWQAETDPQTACAYPQLLIPAELSHDAIDAIGEIGQLQFKDLNADKSVFQRTYANQVRNTMLAVRVDNFDVPPPVPQ